MGCDITMHKKIPLSFYYKYFLHSTQFLPSWSKCALLARCIAQPTPLIPIPGLTPFFSCIEYENRIDILLQANGSTG